MTMHCRLTQPVEKTWSFKVSRNLAKSGATTSETLTSTVESSKTNRSVAMRKRRDRLDLTNEVEAIVVATIISEDLRALAESEMTEIGQAA